MVEIRCVRSDMTVAHRKPVQDAVLELYKRHVSSAAAAKSTPDAMARRGSFAAALRESLDTSFGSKWHVVVGEKVGFACKKRNQTMGVWTIQDHKPLTVVLWRSPGVEDIEPEPTDAKAKVEAEGKPGGKVSPRVVEPQTLEEGSEVSRVAAFLKDALVSSGDDGDTQELAQGLRRRLTAEFGTIWHVVVGTGFVVEAAEDRRNYVVMATSRLRLVCFQHEQRTGGVTINWSAIWASLPYLLLALLCFFYMTMSSVCKEEQPDPSSRYRAYMHQQLCNERGEQRMQYLGGAVLACMFLKRGAAFSKKKSA